MDYFGSSTPTVPATAPSSSPWKKINLLPQLSQISSLAHFSGTTTASTAASTHTLRATYFFYRCVRTPTPSSTKHLGTLQSHLLPLQLSYRVVREHPVLVVLGSERLQRSRARPPIAFYRTISRQQRSRRTFREHHVVTVSRSERCSTPFCGYRPRFIGCFFKTLYHPVPRSTYGVPTTHFRGAFYYRSACLQRHETRRLAGNKASSRLVAPTFWCCPSTSPGFLSLVCVLIFVLF